MCRKADAHSLHLFASCTALTKLILACPCIGGSGSCGCRCHCGRLLSGRRRRNQRRAKQLAHARVHTARQQRRRSTTRRRQWRRTGSGWHAAAHAGLPATGQQGSQVRLLLSSGPCSSGTSPRSLPRGFHGRNHDGLLLLPCYLVMSRCPAVSLHKRAQQAIALCHICQCQAAVHASPRTAPVRVQ